jgi:hypothetical protein
MEDKKYQCIKTFDIDQYDEDGAWNEGTMAIKKGSKWYRSNTSYRFIGGSDTIRLEKITKKNRNDGGWLEISTEHLSEYFKEIA